MRRDMAKKLVDTHREFSDRYRRSGHGRKKGKCLNPDVKRLRRDKPQVDREGELLERCRSGGKEGTRPKGDRKGFGENLSPLFRFLCQQVGRSWNSVYSEICEGMDRRSATGGHIFQHLWDYVVRAEEVVLIDGVPHQKRFRGGFSKIEFTGNRRGSQLWVDPRDGKLKRGVPRKARERQSWRGPDLQLRGAIDIGDGEFMVQHPDSKLWFVVELREQEWRTEMATVLEFDRKRWRHVQVQVPKKVGVHQQAPYPKGLQIPRMRGKTLVVTSCRSASKKDKKAYL